MANYTGQAGAELEGGVGGAWPSVIREGGELLSKAECKAIVSGCKPRLPSREEPRLCVSVGGSLGGLLQITGASLL